MAEQREKTVSYRRAEWFNADPASINLALCVKLAITKLTTVDARTIARRDNGQLIKLFSLKTDGEDGHYLHLVADTPGEAASVDPKGGSSAQELQVSTTPPPPLMDFMDGDAFVYIRGNDVCLCTTGLTDAAVRYYLAELFKKAAIRKDASEFDLSKVGNLDKIKLIHSQGVKNIKLEGTIYKASAEYSRRNGQPMVLLSKVARELKVILGTPHDVNKDALRVSLNLSLDKRYNGIVLGAQRLEKLASETLLHAEEDDDFVIETKLGQKISRTELYMRSTVSIDRFGKSVPRDKAWKELEKFYNTLSSSGALEA